MYTFDFYGTEDLVVFDNLYRVGFNKNLGLLIKREGTLLMDL
jgi:hypothetical protein